MAMLGGRHHRQVGSTCEDAPCAPHVNTCPVEPSTKQKLWRSVPMCKDLTGEP
jgi:hypothetical protein